MTVLNGIDLLIRNPKALAGRKIGLVTNHSAVTRTLKSTVDAIAELPFVQIRALFAPEHGLQGSVQDGVPVVADTDLITALPVYSLYGATVKPTREQLQDLDLLIFDIQDVGCRYYTYATTLSYVMESAAEHGIEVWVLDRPNPLNGDTVEGPLLDAYTSSFVGRYPVPPRHGLTIGEFALWVQAEFIPKCNLRILRMRGWTRGMFWDQTGLTWVAPSPNLPTPGIAMLYPGLCLIEGTNLSEARGTTHPFETFGAPWLGANKLTKHLNGRGLRGVLFRQGSFVPTFSKFTGEACQAVQAHVINRHTFKAFETGLEIIAALIRLHPREFEFLASSWEANTPHFDLLTGSSSFREGLLAGKTPANMASDWKKDERRFARRRSRFLLY